MSVTKAKKAEPTAEPTPRRPTLRVDESVLLSLPGRFSPYALAPVYRQTATTEDLHAFIREVERKFGRDHAVDITPAGISAHRSTPVQQ